MNEDLFDFEESGIETEIEEINDNQFLIFLLGNSKYAFGIRNVIEILLLPETNDIPDTKDYIRGFFKLRNDIVRVIDLRKRLRMKSLDDLDAILVDKLKTMEDKHKIWISDLEKSAKEKRLFSGQLDPTKCDLGQWLLNYITENINHQIYLKQFDLPHRKVHQTGHRVNEYIESGHFDKAVEIVEKLKENEYSQMLNLFSQAPDRLKEAHREICIVMETNGKKIAFTADKVENIITIDDTQIETDNIDDYKDFLKGIGKAANEVYLILDEDKLSDRAFEPELNK
jgi:chemotaxis signal transduction protein